MPHAPDLSGLALDGRYELHALIGEGTFGRVYRGRDRRLARAVAVKVIKPWWADDPDWVQSFEREAQLLARVSDPGIVQIFDVGNANEGLYYVAELVDGESLASRLRRGPLSPPDARDVAEQLCRALDHAHAQRVVHRDVKPANVLISSQGRVKVGDFGVARLADASTDAAAGSIVGTPRYMAPEQARGHPATPATDVYSVGVVLYEMLAGHPPFVEQSVVELALRHLHDGPAPLPVSTPQALVEIVDRALAKHPGHRYAGAGAMADALERAGLQFTAADRSRAVREASLLRARAYGQRPGTAGRAATALVERAPEPIAPTRVAVPMNPRRNVNPAARRRRGAALGLVLALLLAMVAAAIVIGSIGHVRVPNLRGMRAAAIAARARRLSLHAAVSTRYDHAPRGTAIAQSPSPGIEVRDGSTVQVTLSAGPAPVKVPALVGQPAAGARAVLARLRLGARVALVAAPGVEAGTVTGQSPAAGAHLLPRSTVALAVAEIPRWRVLTSFAGDGPASSVPFRIRGRRWRVLYAMNYVGTCTFIVFCSGPNAQVARLTDPMETQFGLGGGSGQERVFESGPGLYQIGVTPGSDTARWSIEVEDYY